MTDKTITLKVIKGLRNDVSQERFEPGDLASATNVDIDVTGRLTRRKGRTLLNAGNCHSLWQGGAHALMVKDGVLNRINTDLTLTSLGVTIAGERVTYAHVDGVTYFSDGLSNSALRADGSVVTWGIPSPVPTVPNIVPGDLPAGVYEYAITLVRVDGWESGALRSVQITLVAQGGLSWATLPTHANASRVRIYLSRVNGTELYRAAEMAVGATNVNIVTMPKAGFRLRTQFLTTPPAGRVYGPWNGRIFVATDKFVTFSEAFQYERFAPLENWWAFDDKVTMVHFVTDGVYVGTTNATYYMAGGDPTSAIALKVLPYGAVLGTEVEPLHELVGGQGIPSGRLALWMSARGPILGLPNGQVLNLAGQRYLSPAARMGAALFRSDLGRPQYVVNLFQ